MTIRTRLARKLGAVGFSAGVVLVVTASVAFACVQVIGTLRVTVTNGGTSMAIGNGTHPAFNMFCDGDGEGEGHPIVNEATAENPTSFRDKPTVTVSYGPSEMCDPIPNLDDTSVRPGRANTPRDGSYEVMFCDGQLFKNKGGTWEFHFVPRQGSCFFTDAVVDRATQMGFMDVEDGAGEGEFQIPFGGRKNQPNNASAITVRLDEQDPGQPPPDGFDSWGPPDVGLVPISMI